MKPSFRARIRSGEVLCGTMVSFDAPEVVEIYARLGFDWLFIEAEHAPMSARSSRGLIQAAGDTPCAVRLPCDSEIEIKRALDSGAAGIIVPRVNTAEQAAEIVQYAKYAPMGMRGIGVARANCYGLAFEDYLRSANDATAVIVQAEHIDAVNNIEAITEVEGIDAVFIGPFDLSASMNQTGNLTHPEVVAAIDEVARVCKAKNVRLGYYAPTVELVKVHIEKGFSLVCCGVDAGLLAQAARETLAGLRS